MTDTVDAEAPAAEAPALTASPPSRRGGRWSIRDEAGRSEMFRPEDGASVRRAARALGVTDDEIRAAVDAAQNAPPPSEFPLGEPEPEPPVRAWQPGQEPVEFAALGAALDDPTPDRFLTWDGIGLCMVDVDLTREAVRDGLGWNGADLRQIVRRAGPTPRYAWPSRSGGLRLIFGPDTRYELSALERAGLHVLMHDDIYRNVIVEKVELIRVTRTPPEGVEVLRPIGDYGSRDLAGALLRTGGRASVPEDAIAAWLAQAGMVEGGRYEHEYCPEDPSPTSGTDPIVVTSDGVQCFRCARFFPWARLVGASRDGRVPAVVAMAENLIHWAHANLALLAERPGVDAPFLRAGYTALLKVLHRENREDENWQKWLARLWSPDIDFVRSEGAWLRVSDYAVVVPSRQSLIALPWSKGSTYRADAAGRDGSLSGFPNIEPVLHLVDEPRWAGDGAFVRVPDVCRETAEPLRELTLEEAEDQMREMLPGVPDQWLRMLRVAVVGGLYGQLRFPQPPVGIVVGRSGSGKGALVAAASGVLGRDAAEILFSTPEELGRAIGAGLEQRAPILWGDEVGKTSGWWRQSSEFLRMGASFTWRKLHVGVVNTPVRALTLIGGSSLPPGLAAMPEFARRACVMRITGSGFLSTAGWMDAVRQYLGGWALQDMRATPAGAAVANAYVAWARQFVLRDEVAPWVSLAVALGAERLDDSNEMREIGQLVQQLYDLWRSGPEVLFYRRGRGRPALRAWRNGAGQDVVAELLADYIDPDAKIAEQKARMAQLSTWPVAPGVSLEFRSSGSRPRIAFVSDVDPLSDARGNPAIFPDPA